MKKLIMVFFIFTLLACKKQNQTTVNFNVKHEFIDFDIKGIGFQIHEINENSNTKKIITDGVTNENGFLQLSFKKQKNKHIRYEYRSNIYNYIIDIVESPNSNQLTENNHYEFNYTINKNISYNFILTNENCVSENDKIRFRYKQLHSNNSSFSSFWIQRTGCNPVVHKGSGKLDDLIIEIEVDKGMGLTTYQDTLRAYYTFASFHANYYINF